MAWGALLRPLMGSFATEMDMSSCQVRILNWIAKGANGLHDACPIDISPLCYMLGDHRANFMRNVKANMPVIDKSSSNEPKQVILAAIFRKEPYKWAPGKSCPQLALFDDCVKKPDAHQRLPSTLSHNPLSDVLPAPRSRTWRQQSSLTTTHAARACSVCGAAYATFPPPPVHKTPPPSPTTRSLSLLQPSSTNRTTPTSYKLAGSTWLRTSASPTPTQRLTTSRLTC